MSTTASSTSGSTGPWATAIAAVTLLQEDLEAAKAFYSTVFDLPVAFEDAHSAVFEVGSVMVNLLRVSAAPELLEPAAVAPPDAGVRFQLTVPVGDVDAVVTRLAALGVPLLNGPVDRPWGIRTASFRDPGGHVWEVAA